MKLPVKYNFRDEKAWIEEETKLIDRIHPFFKTHLILKFLLFIVIVFLIAKFFSFFTTLLMILAISYIRFKRTKYGINIEIEPTYLIAVALTLAFGLDHGLLFVLIPGLLAIGTSGMSIGMLVNLANKFVVVYLTYLYWLYSHNETYLIIFATIIVVLTDIVGFFFRKKFGQPLPEIIQVMATNTILRFMYFSMFLDLVVRLLR
ncbi:MAG: hypothetical protein ABIJ34_04830 [archaeon]